MSKTKKPRQMNSKTNTFFVMTLAVILSVYMITVGSIQPDVADKSDNEHDDR
jgi:multisubunit Na+/H+ antiporter MnhB subunit